MCLGVAARRSTQLTSCVLSRRCSFTNVNMGRKAKIEAQPPVMDEVILPLPPPPAKGFGANLGANLGTSLERALSRVGVGNIERGVPTVGVVACFSHENRLARRLDVSCRWLCKWPNHLSSYYTPPKRRNRLRLVECFDSSVEPHIRPHYSLIHKNRTLVQLCCVCCKH